MNKLFTTLTFSITLTLLVSCGGNDSPFSEGGGSSNGPISDKNFNLFANPVDPKVIDDDGAHGGVEVVITVFAGDRNNASVSGGTVYIQTEWGILDSGSCVLVNGSCSVTWTSDSDFSFISVVAQDNKNTFTAYTLGEESFIDFNGSGNFDDADGVHLRDLDEPYLDLTHDGVYTPGFDAIIDIDGNGIHTPGDTKFNGDGCTHSSLCGSPTRIIIYDIGTLSLDQSTPNTPPTVTMDTPLNGDTITKPSYTFTATAADAEDGTIPDAFILWESSDPAVGIFGFGQSTTIDTSAWAAGVVTITVSVIDVDGDITTSSVSVTVP